MRQKYITLIFIFSALAKVFGSNPCVTSTQLMNESGSIYEGITKTEEYQIVGATVTYTTQSGTNSSSTRTANIVLSKIAELGASFTGQTGEDASTIQEVQYQYDWVLVSQTNTDYSGQQTSLQYWGGYRIVSPWEFVEWIVGPPPTESNNGGPTIDTKPLGNNTRITTTRQKKIWNLSWKEKKCE